MEDMCYSSSQPPLDKTPWAREEQLGEAPGGMEVLSVWPVATEFVLGSS